MNKNNKALVAKKKKLPNDWVSITYNLHWKGKTVVKDYCDVHNGISYSKLINDALINTYPELAEVLKNNKG